MMTQMIVQIAIAVLSAEALFNFIRWLIERRDNKKVSPERIMLRALGAERLGVLCRDWKHADVRDAHDWEVIETLYQGYSKLGGNGEIKKLYDECKEIPTTE